MKFHSLSPLLALLLTRAAAADDRLRASASRLRKGKDPLAGDYYYDDDDVATGPPPHRQPRGAKADPVPFEPAVSLEGFRDVDPADFEWVNADEIAPGATTCGFLHAPLGSNVGVAYPTVQVYVCVKFAANQPAPRGNMAVHCGGPGSLSNCVYLLGSREYLGTNNVENYNLIAFDQRGMGRSVPSFIVEECHMPDVLLNFTYGEYGDVPAMTRVAEALQRNVKSCWDFEGFKAEEGGTTYHFLEHSGTRQLVEDIERTRLVFGDTRLSVVGVSYGTKVMGTYATLFPQSVQLMVLDGNDDPHSDILANAQAIARSHNQRIDYFVASCEASDHCRLDLRACFADLRSLPGSARTKGSAFLSMFSSPVNEVDRLCHMAKNGDAAGVQNFFLKAETKVREERRRLAQQIEEDETDSPSKPTTGMSDAWPFPGYASTASPLLAQRMITGQDYTFGAYSPSAFAEVLADIHARYSGQATGLPVMMAAVWYSMSAFWPNDTPLSPIGNPSVSGIISGQMFDPNTPYIWTMAMRESFPSATLITSRASAHGFNAARDFTQNHRCLKHLRKYLEDGVIEVVDGQVCAASDMVDTCTLIDIVSGQQC